MLLRSPYLLEHFRPQELIAPSLYRHFGEASIRYMDERLLAVLRILRVYIDAPMTINNWHNGGTRDECGIRLPGQPHYRVGSAHSWGMAFDAVGSWDADEVREDILLGRIEMPYPVRLEEGISWLHVDVMNVGNKPVEVFSP